MNMYGWSMSDIKVWLSYYFSLLAYSLFLVALKTFLSPLSKKDISHQHLNIKDMNCHQKVIPL